MKVLRTKYLVLSIIGIITYFFAVSFKSNTDPQKLTVPKGWPKPFYNFQHNGQSEDKFRLGRKLFYDPILSRDGTISCSSCHTQLSAFTHVDHGLSHGIGGLKGTRNSLVLVNLAWNRSFMWDGGINNLEVQPLGPITNKVEMDNTLENVVKSLNKSYTYRTRFYKAFGDSVITGQMVLKALAQFTGMFQSFNSKYDKYVRHEEGGDFTAQELNGLKLFRQNCASCHKEPLFTDYSFKNIGLPVDTGLNDIGRMKITGDRNDSLKFKVPTLLNVAMSYPYMHDGRFKSLGQVMNHYTGGAVMSPNVARELKDGMKLSSNDKVDIIAFLLTLTDKDFLFDTRFRYNPED